MVLRSLQKVFKPYKGAFMRKIIFGSLTVLIIIIALSVSGMNAQASVPVHGRWCGPQHGGGEPIDAVDAVCRDHDQCYERKGYFNCACDRELIARLPDAIRRTNTASGKAAGASVARYFQSAGCQCRKEICVRTPFGKKCQTVITPGVGGAGPC